MIEKEPDGMATHEIFWKTQFQSLYHYFLKNNVIKSYKF